MFARVVKHLVLGHGSLNGNFRATRYNDITDFYARIYYVHGSWVYIIYLLYFQRVT